MQVLTQRELKTVRLAHVHISQEFRVNATLLWLPTLRIFLPSTQSWKYVGGIEKLHIPCYKTPVPSLFLGNHSLGFLLVVVILLGGISVELCEGNENHNRDSNEAEDNGGGDVISVCILSEEEHKT